MKTTIPFDNSFAMLTDGFFSLQMPDAAPAPDLIVYNDDLGSELGIDKGETAELAAIFGGTEIPQGAEPLAQLYAGHQFGQYNPQLGDGRAVLLGEVVDLTGKRRDIQLKGSGRTPYSRGGDGKAWLGPVLREYVVSEAMHALGIPTTRALAAVSTGEQVYRETLLPGAVVTRIAASHIRVGTFQVFAARGQIEACVAWPACVTDEDIHDAGDEPGAAGLPDAQPLPRRSPRGYSSHRCCGRGAGG